MVAEVQGLVHYDDIGYLEGQFLLLACAEHAAY